jgi:hypothetical protein
VSIDAAVALVKSGDDKFTAKVVIDGEATPVEAADDKAQK